ncbi:MAG: AGE family epimerase/isomerase [Bacteroidota bacterium]|nr:AGE family epimerase/isomerase [Bacteroidota bacterium]
MMNDRFRHLAVEFRTMLFDDIIPFWLRHGRDHEFGGCLHHLDRRGDCYSGDKGIWIQCRTVWIFARLYNTCERNPEWLDFARDVWNFVDRFAFDADGRMFFLVTRDGRPLRKRRYVFSEAFATIAGAEYARAAGDERAKQRALFAFQTLWRAHQEPGLLPPKVNPSVRPIASLAMPMIILGTAQELREHVDTPLCGQAAQGCIDEILARFVHPEHHALLEYVRPDGGMLEGPAGRLVNPGHSLETAWFLLREAVIRKDRSLVDVACRIIEWSLERGWDRDEGGLFAFVDLDGRPCEQLEWDMKLWWPHAEALVALMCAFLETGKRQYAEWYERVHDYTFSHFPDPEYGEWFGYLHRDGTVANEMKGGLWKGPYHVPRAMWMLLGMLEKRDGTPSLT